MYAALKPKYRPKWCDIVGVTSNTTGEVDFGREHHDVVEVGHFGNATSNMKIVELLDGHCTEHKLIGRQVSRKRLL